MLLQWYFNNTSFHWTLFSYISLLALPLSVFLLCLLSDTLFRRRQNGVVSLPTTRQNEGEGEGEGETASSSSSLVSSSGDDDRHGGGVGGSNRKREFVICAVCASRLVVSGSNRTWAPEERQQGDFVVCASSLAASSGGNGKTGEEEKENAAIVGGGGLRRKEEEFVVCTSSLVEQSGRNETGEEMKAAIDEGKSRKKVEFAISTSTAFPAGCRDGKSSLPASAAITDDIESSSKQELVTRTSKLAVQNGGTGTEAAIINDQESAPNEEELGPDGNHETAVDEFFSCVSGMVPIVTTGPEGGPAIDLVRLSIGEVDEEEEELESCSLMSVDDDDEQDAEVVKASSLAPAMISGGETEAAIGDGKSSLKEAVLLKLRRSFSNKLW